MEGTKRISHHQASFINIKRNKNGTAQKKSTNVYQKKLDNNVCHILKVYKIKIIHDFKVKKQQNQIKVK